MVDDFVEKKLPKFKKIFPEYQGRRLFCGMGALAVKDAVGRYAEKAGLYVLTQTVKGVLPWSIAKTSGQRNSVE